MEHAAFFIFGVLALCVLVFSLFRFVDNWDTILYLVLAVAAVLGILGVVYSSGYLIVLAIVAIGLPLLVAWSALRGLS